MTGSPRARGGALLLACAAALAVTGPASASFVDSGTAASGAVTTLTVQPPVLTTALVGCVNGLFGLFGTPRISLVWARSSQVAAGGTAWGQEVVLVSPAGRLLPVTSGAVTASSTGAEVTGSRTTPGAAAAPLEELTTYAVRVRSTLGGWSSADGPTSQATVTTGLC